MRNRVGQVLNFLFAILYSLLAIRLGLALVSARPGAAFVRWMRGATDPLILPFQGVLPEPVSEDGYLLVLPVLLGILLYAVLHLLFRGVLHLVGARRTTVYRPTGDSRA